jgi:hypothetical protein
MIGYVLFAISIIVLKSHYRSVYERIYSEFQENILYVPSVIDPYDRLLFVLFGENVFTVDSVLTIYYNTVMKFVDSQPLANSSNSYLSHTNNYRTYSYSSNNRPYFHFGYCNYRHKKDTKT